MLFNKNCNFSIFDQRIDLYIYYQLNKCHLSKADKCHIKLDPNQNNDAFLNHIYCGIPKLKVHPLMS